MRDAVARFGRPAHLAVTPGEVLRLWSPDATRGHGLAFLGQAAEGLMEIDQALAWARAARHPAVEAECLWHHAEALAVLGQPVDAIEAAEQAAGIAARIGLRSGPPPRTAAWVSPARRRAPRPPNWPTAARSKPPRAFRCSAPGHSPARRPPGRQGRPGEAAPHVQAALEGGIPLTRHEARWAHAELLASQGDGEACRAAAAAALDQAQDGDYLILVPRLGELAAR